MTGYIAGRADASLDALAAAPDHHTLLFENERVRVLDTRVRAGNRTPIHTHCWPSVLYIQSWNHFVRYDDQGGVMLDSRTVEGMRNPPSILWSNALAPHSLLNVGDTDLHVLSVELKEK